MNVFLRKLGVMNVKKTPQHEYLHIQHNMCKYCHTHTHELVRVSLQKKDQKEIILGQAGIISGCCDEIVSFKFFFVILLCFPMKFSKL